MVVSIEDIVHWLAYDFMGTLAFGLMFRNLEGESFIPEAAQR